MLAMMQIKTLLHHRQMVRITIWSGNLSSDWTKYSSTINGIDGGLPTKFRPTAFIKVGCIFNYSHDAYHDLYIAGITLREATPFSVDGTAFQTANGKVKILDNGTGGFSGRSIKWKL